jgi:hypothetical protein
VARQAVVRFSSHACPRRLARFRFRLSRWRRNRPQNAFAHRQAHWPSACRFVVRRLTRCSTRPSRMRGLRPRAGRRLARFVRRQKERAACSPLLATVELFESTCLVNHAASRTAIAPSATAMAPYGRTTKRLRFESPARAAQPTDIHGVISR